MRADIQWIYQGRPLGERPRDGDVPMDDRELLDRVGAVRVVSGELGTEIRWSVLSPCFASLFHVSEMLLDLPAPYMLRYFLAGWFEEQYQTGVEARRRIVDLVWRGDIHLTANVFVREFEPGNRKMPDLLRHVWMDGNAMPDYSVDCVYEESSGRFRVDRIGPKSTIARLWGVTPASYPCLNGGSYDRTVGAAYGEVLKQGRPRYDHVYAAMRTPDDTIVWIPYQRVIVPKRFTAAARAVSVVTEICKVDIDIV
jgi:hypothetical protein